MACKHVLQIKCVVETRDAQHGEELHVELEKHYPGRLRWGAAHRRGSASVS